MTPGDRRALKTIGLLVALGALARLPGNLSPVAATVEAQAPNTGRSNRDSLLVQSQRMSSPLGRGEKVDISSASSVEIGRLPGIGPALSRRIVAYREENGSFRSIEDLQGVSGIGPSLAARTVPHVSFAIGPAITRRRSTREASLRINVATAQELSRLPGIGPIKAEAIVAFRETQGPFRAVEDLALVSGIGSVTVAKLKGLVRVP
jgi:competence protein ComEA